MPLHTASSPRQTLIASLHAQIEYGNIDTGEETPKLSLGPGHALPGMCQTVVVICVLHLNYDGQRVRHST